MVFEQVLLFAVGIVIFLALGVRMSRDGNRAET